VDFLSCRNLPFYFDNKIQSVLLPLFHYALVLQGILFIGIADTVISFLRIEGFLPFLFGSDLASDLGRSAFRGTYVHFPMVGLGLLVATFHRGLGFPWLALLVVTAELLIVFTRFVFSYEQAFMADLVRFWYAALFLFASAYTLLEEGHVRVDVLYSTFSERTKGMVNAAGSVLLGISLCAVILYYGMGGRATAINGPLLQFEVTQTGFGMYVKYWMAGFLGIFAISMQIQFAGYFLEGIADYRGEPGKRALEAEVAQAG
jgi:TRAP-type mannitol/chloroaromatic compound transport system permease small subunit